MNNKKNYKSPLRYPGGKSKFAQSLFEKFPNDFKVFKEPFVGGGSVFLEVLYNLPDVTVWINDLNPEVHIFWYELHWDFNQLINEIQYIKDNYKDGYKLFNELKNADLKNYTNLERAVRFFVLNRITFSGTIESGGYSQSAFEKRFTQSSITRLENLKWLNNKPIIITNLDYKDVIKKDDYNNGFIYCDPPYLSAKDSKLYGKNGDLHSFFNHEEFANTMRQCNEQWLISYDDCDIIRDLFSFANIEEINFQYSMTNKKGKELIITNY